MWAIKNVVSGEVLGIQAGNGAVLDRRTLDQFCEQMNLEHAAGSDHVVECHDGEPQQYKVVMKLEARP